MVVVEEVFLIHHIDILEFAETKTLPAKRIDFEMYIVLKGMDYRKINTNIYSDWINNNVLCAPDWSNIDGLERFVIEYNEITRSGNHMHIY